MSVDVLIIEDDRHNRHLLTRFVKEAGYEHRAAESGEQGLAMYAERRPSVVLLDIRLPGIDGYETARRMKAQLRDHYVPILMLTSLSGPECMARGLAAGADDFLSKPYDRLLLESRLQSALRTKHLFDALEKRTGELRQIHERETKEQMLAERVMARQIRSELLSAPFIKYRSVPAGVFNGDLLMAEATPRGCVRIMLADFAGHGLSAAVGSQPVAGIFRSMTKKGHPVENVLQVANNQLRDYLPPELFLAACVVEVDPSDESMKAWNAGMPPVLVRGAAGGIKARFPSKHLPLGIVDGVLGDKSAQRVVLEVGDRIFLHSDGLTEAIGDGPTGEEEYGEARLAALIGSRDKDEPVFDRLVDEHLKFVGGRRNPDDLTLIEIEYGLETMVSVLEKPLSRPTKLRLDLTLGPAALSCDEPGDWIQRIVEALPMLRTHSHFSTVLIELVSNSIDHGVLGLDSSIKDQPDGFELYYQRRAYALRNLVCGHVRLEVQVQADAVVIRVEDSGPGFDVSRECRWGDRDDSTRRHGRGIVLARSLCRRLEYFGTGNQVEAVLDLPTATTSEIVSAQI